MRPAAITRWCRGLVVAFSVVLLGGCSLLSLTYERLGTIVLWRLDSWWDLDDAQRRGLAEALQRWHAWHRREQLPAVADALARWQTLAAGPVDAETVCREGAALRALLRQASQRTIEDLARWLPTLSDAQLTHWQRRLAEDDEQWRREWGDLDPDRSERFKRTRARLESFYGRLDEAQRRWLRERLLAAGDQPELAWAERQRRQADWLDTARRLRSLPVDAARAEVAALWERTWRSPDPKLAAWQERVWAQGCAWLADWHARATPAQRARAVAQLASYERELRALAANGNGR
ncbi:MAG: DUF6279 family lipoprotein [Tepidimonas sp.]|uniref:DUF6279 family lipoprotein n=1 Tax=Tepidimonas sp. TaxID=2002775 RepID=UPI00298F0922|nr:DUF6279 family lipoprotein [Tepidimonas sp.]MCS6811181.1 DUF6279 family lipoprotein [Tepidimonas sp.]MDW8337319.1 DUF6279 family lipoprotein [Tepidimonas sp.]